MGRRNNREYDEEEQEFRRLEDWQRRYMLPLIREIMSDKTILEVSIENAFGTFSISRRDPTENEVGAIGFEIASSDDFEE